MKIIELLRSDDPRYKGSLWFFLGAYFFVLFNYPLIRAASTTLFFEDYGAKSSPLAWLWTVLFLSVSIVIFNRFQSRHSVQRVFLWASILSTLLFGASAVGFLYKIKFLSFLSFIWKEIYIVLQVHLLLAYANNYFKKEEFKLIVGPVGAAGSIGGIFGGLLTSYISQSYGTIYVAFFGLIFVLLPAILFLKTTNLRTVEEGKKTVSPLASLDNKDIKQYVFYIALIVMLSQFIINIADFKFNINFEKTIGLARDRTAYLGWIYTWTNSLTFILQFVCLPLLIPRISEKSLHLFIPFSYMACTIGLFFMSGSLLLPIAALYVYLKAADYSLFSAGKELLYQP
ncbi:MAG TPA: MFS transporter, partial [Anaerovoracaceae bacterium]|nr:MFS transporter [Anaerovoracaceae bacterium]